MSMELLKVIDFIAVFQIVVFIIILSHNRKLTRANKFFLNLYLISILICLLDRIQFFYHTYLYMVQFPHFYHISDPFHLLYLPAFYFYLLSVIRTDFKIRMKQVFHLLPTLLFLLNLLVQYTFQPVDIKFSLLKAGPFYKTPFELQMYELFHLLQLGYLIAGLFEVQQYQTRLKTFYSSFRKFNITPLHIMIGGMLSIRIFKLIYHIIDQNAIVPIDIDLTLYAGLIIFLGYKQSKIFLHPLASFKDMPAMKIDQATVTQLYSYMKTEKPYLDPLLTLNDLAERLSIKPRELSNILNIKIGQSFFNFVNGYRIEEAKECLVSMDKNITVLEILYQVGFNNKSAFNRVFKQFTGVSPSEYRKQYFNRND